MSAAEQQREPQHARVLRDSRPGDLALVFSSWLGSDAFSRAGQACARVYKREHERVVRAIIERPGVIIRVACCPDDEDAILGWACIQPGTEAVCFYVYVKKGVREDGIARDLLGEMVAQHVEYTHQPVRHFKDKRPPAGWCFNPYRNHR